MKVIINRCVFGVPFHNLRPGDVFVWGRYAYMKTSQPTSLNAIVLESGGLTTFTDLETRVFPQPNASLTLDVAEDPER